MNHFLPYGFVVVFGVAIALLCAGCGDDEQGVSSTMVEEDAHDIQPNTLEGDPSPETQLAGIKTSGNRIYVPAPQLKVDGRSK